MTERHGLRSSWLQVTMLLAICIVIVRGHALVAATRHVAALLALGRHNPVLCAALRCAASMHDPVATCCMT